MSLPVPAPADPAIRNQSASGYNATRYGTAIDWTSKCMLIDGIPRVIVSAEFQYFRVPDETRWRPLLAAIRAAGFNAVRIYVHWGYHSPAEGKFILTGNRDLRYLLELCTELHLWVIPAPGPYICAEVQGGGYPIWLIAKRHLRIRHLTNPPVGMLKKWDQSFHDYCAGYFDMIVRIFVPYERTTNPNGCVIALQIENELRQQTLGFGGLDNELRLLAEIARNAGSTVPIFHNDDSAAGSWVSSLPYRTGKNMFLRRAGPPAFTTDIYGFDLYFTFPPGDKSGDKSSLQAGMIEVCGLSATLNLCGIGGVGLGGSDTSGLSCLYNHDLSDAPPPPLAWAATKQMTSAVDSLEQKCAHMSGCAAVAPPIVAEAQVGWINQWGRLRGYDEIYNFFGHDFSATLQVSLMAQGISITNQYTAYGGTNHGSVGDTEVYSSYDYSAFIREYGKLSERGRRLRLTNFFVRTFATHGLAHTESLHSLNASSRKTDGNCCSKACSSVSSNNLSSNATSNRVKATLPGILVKVRQAVLPFDELVTTSLPQRVRVQPPMFAALRNLVGAAGLYNLIVDDLVVPCFTPPCEAMIAPLYIPILDNLRGGGAFKLKATVIACTIPVIARATHAGSELWILKVREAEKGRLILRLGENDEDEDVSANNPRGLNVQYVSIDRSDDNVSGPDCDPAAAGKFIVTDQDPGAATSYIDGPLEEMPLSHWDEFSRDSAPIAVRASTESAGLCFSFAFAGHPNPCAISICDIRASKSGEAYSQPVLRLLCLPESDARTLTVNCDVDDPFQQASPKVEGQDSPGIDVRNKFAAAWGAEEIGFEPAGQINIAYSLHSPQNVFLVCNADTMEIATEPSFEAFAPANPAIAKVLPRVYTFSPPRESTMNLLNTSLPDDPLYHSRNPLSKIFEIPLENWRKRTLDWSTDCEWKPIVSSNFEPLDHMMTSGHIAYRLRFTTKSKHVSIVLNVRHVAAIWCNGVFIGSQLCFSHNILSAGAMHGIDLPHAGKKRHNLSHAMNAVSPVANGVQEVLILVLSFGQSRCPFLLNDIRNKRGLLSARLSRRAKAKDVQWSVAGVNVAELDNPYSSAGLPMEAEMNDPLTTNGLVSVAAPRVVADEGVVYYRATFKVPQCTVVGGNVRYPLRIRVRSCRHALGVFWVNGLQIGRYVDVLGPQHNFYIPEGVITNHESNLLVIAVYGPVDGDFEVKILPWIVEDESGNMNDVIGDVFALGTMSLTSPGVFPARSSRSSFKLTPVSA